MLKLLVGDMLENLSKYNVVLASNSPRRKELLSGLGIPYEVKTLPELIITADTIVWLNGEVMGKPCDEADARRMLKALSGQTHQVITGVCLTTNMRQVSFATVTDVTFACLSDEEINYYVEHYRPMDKAGSYGIQEWIGFVGVERISGSYFNVVGMPIQRLYTELKAF